MAPDVSDALLDDPPARDSPRDALLVLLPLLIVLSTFLFLLLLFLVCVILLRRRRGIALRDGDGPVDMSREELIEGEGGFDGIESRWLETVDEHTRRSYLRAKEWQLQYPPNSLPTDITLSQFLSIQEKGVSAWSFDPDYEMISSLLVHARTELTFLPDPASATSVQSNLPLPKLNEVYYWEVKMFDLPESTNVAVGLATKPYPSFRLPGQSRYSVAYNSNGDKSYNYPFTASTYGGALKEGDVLGVGYRPRSGTVFFTRNGRKMEDAFIGLNNWNLFPTIGADGPCSLHVNLGQAGFVFIEANVKKWGLAPSIGTLAPPPAYGSERGSILLEAGGGVVPGSLDSSHSPHTRRTHRSRRPRHTPSTTPVEPSPLRAGAGHSPPPPLTPPPPITPIDEEGEGSSPGPSSRGYLSPTDLPFHTPPNIHIPASPPHPRHPADANSSRESASQAAARSLSPSRGADSELAPVQALSNFSSAHTSDASGNDETLRSDTPSLSRREPPAYSPLDAYAYSDGVQIDLPAEVIAAALERGTLSSDMVTATRNSRSERRRSRRRGPASS